MAGANMANATEETNLWSELLSNVQARATSDSSDACVLVLGDANSGKTSLVSRLRSGEQPARAGHGLEFNYIEVAPEATAGSAAPQQADVGPGEVSRLGVYVLGGDTAYAPLVKFVFGNDPRRINRCLAILCASMAEPWSVLGSLEQWARVLDDCVRLAGQQAIDRKPGADDVLAAGRRRQELYWQTYVEPAPAPVEGETGEGEQQPPAATPVRERLTSLDEQTLLPLGEDVLTSNIGVPIVVALTKCDMMPSLERDCDIRDEHFDFIQMHVRRFCLKYGASLAYTSAKDRRNCDALRAHVLRRTDVAGDGAQMTADCVGASVVDRDSVFIPAGWDNTKKIAILHEGLAPEMSPDDRYSLHIKRPPPRNLHRVAGPDSAVQSEEEQAFLSRVQPMFAIQPAANAQTPTPQAIVDIGSNGHARSRSPRKVGKPTPAAAATGAQQPAATAAGGPGVDPAGGSLVQEFFKNLLTTKAGAPATNAAAGGQRQPAGKHNAGGGPTSEAELELLRLAKGSRAPVS